MFQKSSAVPLTVSQLNEYVKYLLDSSPILSKIAVRGEISNFIFHRSGHMYFTLKDEASAVKTVMFSSSAKRLKFLPENGMKVIVSGRISAFVRDGQYQLYADTMEPDGIGALYLAFEKLKAKLESEGLFDESRKKPLPAFPSSVGIVTSPEGAALRDMINISKRRYPLAKLTLFPAAVQGENAPRELLAGIEYFSESKSVDVIIIGRGGGSFEDLYGFNDEKLARAIAVCPIPVISAVGHETDFTICDFVASKRAPTPSAAAELALPESADIRRRLAESVQRAESALSASVSYARKRVERAAASRTLVSPDIFVADRRMSLISLEQRLDAQLRASGVIASGRERTASAEHRLVSAATIAVSKKRSVFESTVSKLEALNPLSVISRGYSAVFDSKGGVVSKIADLDVNDNFSLRVSDGIYYGIVKEKEEFKNE